VPLYPAPIQYKYPDPPASVLQNLEPLEAPTGELLSLESIKLRFRTQHNYLFLAESGQEVIINVESKKLGSEKEVEDGLMYSIINSQFEELEWGSIAPDETETISFTALQQGVYALLVNPINNAYFITATNVPIMVYERNMIHVITEYDPLYFWVPENTSFFSFDVEGQSTYEGCTATVYGPKGSGYPEVASDSTTAEQNYFTLNVTVPPDSTNDLWKIQFSDPADPAQHLEDVKFSVTGIEPLFGLTDDPSYVLLHIAQMGGT
jgi:hypothetical protein